MDGGQQLAIQYRTIGDLIPCARNARTHDAAQVALIAGSIREFGFTNPVLVDDANGIIARQGRVMAARQLGLSQVPVIELSLVIGPEQDAPYCDLRSRYDPKLPSYLCR
ncbi:ParB/Srx family N-terminal domain-containing protein [Cypionkella psychrotolerans]|uniref:ParB/Srx family N-terminal domain-containing protein n=1 Tax=Cypionkella psychrotolerans TaxID=1678131 RepID=UPI0006B5322C|nr:ParB/Srx family N-terminal domain-containing protein [Cypionkella psychrotolerans]